jgi:LmbE family N-acetylglucosaminyl deacetylase
MEAFCSVEALGATGSMQLDLGDGTLGLAAHHPGSPARQLVSRLGGHLAQVTLVLTWGPDGGYGHGDHRMVSALATQVVQAMPAATRPKLLYVGIPAGRRPQVPEMAEWAVTDPALLTEAIAYTPADLDAAKAAAQCHVTQFDEATRAGMMPLFDATMWQGKVHFRPAF